MGTQFSDGAAPESAVKKSIYIESSERSERIRELSSAVTHRHAAVTALDKKLFVTCEFQCSLKPYGISSSRRKIL